MSDFKSMIPMFWPGGPLEAARQNKSAGSSENAGEVSGRWNRPEALRLLDGTPINALVIPWAAGLPEDAEQQKTSLPLAEAAKKRGLTVLGWVEKAADPRPAAAAAKSAGLSGIIATAFPGQADVPVLACSGRDGVPWDAPGSVLVLTENVWPGVSMAAGGQDSSSGPTAAPWLDSNGWFVQMACARISAPVWLSFDPPGKGEIVPPQSYSSAICDSEIAGGRWIISLDARLRADLLAGLDTAQKTWKEICAAAAFFEKRSEWKTFASRGEMGVLSDFSRDNFDFGGEILNLMARRDLLFRVLWKSQVTARSFEGLKAMVYADKEKPAPALREKLIDFVQQGGLLLAGYGWGPEGRPLEPEFMTQYELRSLGKGRLAVAREEIPDPYQVAVDAQLLLSHRHDLMKIFNGSSSGCNRFLISPDGNRCVLQTLSYASSFNGRREGALRTVWVRDACRSAKVWTIGAEPEILAAEPSDHFEGMEFHLPARALQPFVALEYEMESRRQV